MFFYGVFNGKGRSLFGFTVLSFEKDLYLYDFFKGLRFRERQTVMCAGRKMTISTGLRIDWVWKHMNA